MQVRLDIRLEQIIDLVKQLSAQQISLLKAELEITPENNLNDVDLKSFLLKAPIFKKSQFEQIAQTRKQINQWRTK